VAGVLDHDGRATPSEERALREASTLLERLAPGKRVDVLVLGCAGPVIDHAVLGEGALVLDRDPARRAALVGRTIAEYLDWKPTHEIGMAVARDGLRARLARGST
jgi:hypothetical protein